MSNPIIKQGSYWESHSKYVSPDISHGIKDLTGKELGDFQTEKSRINSAGYGTVKKFAYTAGNCLMTGLKIAAFATAQFAKNLSGKVGANMSQLIWDKQFGTGDIPEMLSLKMDALKDRDPDEMMRQMPNIQHTITALKTNSSVTNSGKVGDLEKEFQELEIELKKKLNDTKGELIKKAAAELEKNCNIKQIKADAKGNSEFFQKYLQISDAHTKLQKSYKKAGISVDPDIQKNIDAAGAKAKTLVNNEITKQSKVILDRGPFEFNDGATKALKELASLKPVMHNKCFSEGATDENQLYSEKRDLIADAAQKKIEDLEQNMPAAGLDAKEIKNIEESLAQLKKMGAAMQPLEAAYEKLQAKQIEMEGTKLENAILTGTPAFKFEDKNVKGLEKLQANYEKLDDLTGVDTTKQHYEDIRDKAVTGVLNEMNSRASEISSNGFKPGEEEKISKSIAALKSMGADTTALEVKFKELVKANSDIAVGKIRDACKPDEVTASLEFNNAAVEKMKIMAGNYAKLSKLDQENEDVIDANGEYAEAGTKIADEVLTQLQKMTPPIDPKKITLIDQFITQLGKMGTPSDKMEEVNTAISDLKADNAKVQDETKLNDISNDLENLSNKIAPKTGFRLEPANINALTTFSNNYANLVALQEQGIENVGAAIDDYEEKANEVADSIIEEFARLTENVDGKLLPLTKDRLAGVVPSLKALEKLVDENKWKELLDARTALLEAHKAAVAASADDEKE